MTVKMGALLDYDDKAELVKADKDEQEDEEEGNGGDAN